MNIYFTASIVGKKQFLPNYEKIISILESKGHKVISEHIVKTTEPEIRLESKEARLKFQEKLDKWINSADCIVAETSFPSISVGYEISLALSRGKPVLILYTDGNPPSLLAHHKDEKLVCERYDQICLKGIIEDFLNYVSDQDGIRFTFYITSDLNLYLEDMTKKSKIPKAVYIRKLLQEDKHKNG
jgi:2'-deoxynucleoside 5'-phosphate N-hydrolase